MKRLTPEDRERMLKSRALPEDLDMQQPLSTASGHGSPSEPWLSPNPGTSIRTMNDLEQIVVHSMDMIKTPDEMRGKDKVQSIISQNIYPSPRSISNPSLPPPYLRRRQSTGQPAMAMTTASVEEERLSVSHIKNMMRHRARIRPRRETIAVFGREVTHFTNSPSPDIAEEDASDADEGDHEVYDHDTGADY